MLLIIKVASLIVMLNLENILEYDLTKTRSFSLKNTKKWDKKETVYKNGRSDKKRHFRLINYGWIHA